MKKHFTLPTSWQHVDDYNRYQIGVPSYFRNIANERYKNMLHLIAYDIANPKRLAKTAKVCEDYGVRVERSVFECDLTEEDFQNFWQEINAKIDHDEDILIVYKICASCVQKTLTAGPITRPRKILAYIF